MRRLTILVFFILLSCSKDSPIPDAVVPTPSVTKFTLAVAASEEEVLILRVVLTMKTLMFQLQLLQLKVMPFLDGQEMLREVQTR